MSRVLFATDLSEAAGTAGRLIENLPWPSDTTFRLVTVVPWPTDLVGTPWLMAGPVDAEQLEETQIARARKGLAEAAARLAAHGRKVSWVVMRGQAADAIVDVARREGVDLVVVGSRGLGAIEGALLGSVSEAVADRAPCPVLIARSAEISRSIVADDGSPGAEAAIEYVATHTWLLGAVTRLLAVRSVGDLWAESFEMPVDAARAQGMADDQAELWRRARAALEADADRLVHAGHRNTVVALEEGRPGHEIVEAAAHWEADLVVVGSRHRTGVTRLVLGSVGRHVLHHSHCSVLLVGQVPASDPAPADPPAPDAARDLAVAGGVSR